MLPSSSPASQKSTSATLCHVLSALRWPHFYTFRGTNSVEKKFDQLTINRFNLNACMQICAYDMINITDCDAMFGGARRVLNIRRLPLCGRPLSSRTLRRKDLESSVRTNRPHIRSAELMLAPSRRSGWFLGRRLGWVCSASSL